MSYGAALQVSAGSERSLYHDGSKLHMETSTLLEPANRVVAWAEGDEKKEIAGVLGALRKRHDELKKQALKREAEIRDMRVRPQPDSPSARRRPSTRSQRREARRRSAWRPCSAKWKRASC